jgi:glutathione S-transferase
VIRLMGLEGAGDHPEGASARGAIEAYYAEMDRHLAGRDHLAGPFSYADIAFYMAQFFAARMRVPMSPALPNLAAWRRRVAARPAVRHVIGAMADYLRSQNRPVPEFG